jgi:hypothetical protein
MRATIPAVVSSTSATQICVMVPTKSKSLFRVP